MATKQRESGVCPVCNGSGRVDAGNREYRYVMSGYDKEMNTLRCTNCGGQTQYGWATGKVNLREDGTPCVHEYVGEKLGNCYYGYYCKHCKDYYTIDSGG